MSENQSEDKEGETSPIDLAPDKKPSSWLHRLGALTVTIIAMWYLFGIPGYILFEKFLGTDPSDAAESDLPQAAPE